MGLSGVTLLYVEEHLYSNVQYSVKDEPYYYNTDFHIVACLWTSPGIRAEKERIPERTFYSLLFYFEGNNVTKYWKTTCPDACDFPLFLIREWLGWDDLEKEEEYKESH